MKKSALRKAVASALNENGAQYPLNWDDVPRIVSTLKDNLADSDFPIYADQYSQEWGDSVVLTTYYSDKLRKSIILEWDWSPARETEEDFIDSLIDIVKVARACEAQIN